MTGLLDYIYLIILFELFLAWDSAICLVLFQGVLQEALKSKLFNIRSGNDEQFLVSGVFLKLHRNQFSTQNNCPNEF